jgi:hypothetical protein
MRAIIPLPQEPQSDVNKEFWWANKRQHTADEACGAAGDAAGFQSTYDQLKAGVEQLRTFAALEPGPILRPKRDTPLTPEEFERLRQCRLAEIRPPADATITSLHVRSVPPGVKARELMPFFLPYGPIRSISRDTALMSAVVTYHRRADAEAACRALHESLAVGGSQLRLMWARKRPAGGAIVLPAGAQTGASTEQPRIQPKRPLLPPGVAPPPGVRAGSEYAATDPEASGARPDIG